MTAAPLAVDLAIDIDMLDALKALLPVILVVIALLFAVAVRIVSRPGGIRVSADDPYFFPIGECPMLPHQIVPPTADRFMDADDFRAWGIPLSDQRASVDAPRQMKENGGRSTEPRSSAAVLSFPRNEA